MDILRCIEIIVVMTSHMQLLFVEFSCFAIGGAIGNACLLFCLL